MYCTPFSTHSTIARTHVGRIRCKPLNPISPYENQRRMLVVVADKADRTREQNTVGDLSRGQVDAALQRQLHRSKKTSLSAPGPGFADDVDSSTKGEGSVKAIKGRNANKEEHLESLRALGELKNRMPLMAQTNIDFAMKRLLDGGKTSNDSSKGVDNAGKSSRVKSKSSSQARSETGKPSKPRKPRKNKAEAPASATQSDAGLPPVGKHDPDQQFNDGTVMYTAETLSKIGFNDLSS